MASRRSGPRLLTLADPELAFRPELEHARGIVRGFVPPDAEQERQRARVLDFVAEHPRALHRDDVAGHLTASALVVDHGSGRALLTLHAKLGRWLQLGGHCDGDANLPAVALREASEESGIAALRIDPRPIDVDVHAIPARAGEPAHLHLDTRFVVHAPPGAEPVRGPESRALRWFRPDELQEITADESVLRLFRRVFGRP